MTTAVSCKRRRERSFQTLLIDESDPDHILLLEGFLTRLYTDCSVPIPNLLVEEVNKFYADKSRTCAKAKKCNWDIESSVLPRAQMNPAMAYNWDEFGNITSSVNDAGKQYSWSPSRDLSSRWTMGDNAAHVNRGQYRTYSTWVEKNSFFPYGAVVHYQAHDRALKLAACCSLILVHRSAFITCKPVGLI
ncbi:hypothetical protein E6O75_ATG03293 [Venturia nashicola]|uniref:Uncharacterized protein n=1 Tax=Venturia nashicola TaxID=86259 RepID=A0A4Z1P4C4_9PEZI|nr:hypothetical protein E6O75_ATG03293 [Venturia nashicola]